MIKNNQLFSSFAAFFVVIFSMGRAMAADMQVITPTQTSITIEQNKGNLIRLPQVAKTVFIANSDIAEVMVRSPQLVYLTARTPGQTTLFAVGNNNNILASLNVTVEPNLSELRTQVKTLFPKLDIDISSIGSSVMLRGEVKTPQQAAMVKQLAVRALGSEDAVLNQLSVQAPSQINLRVQVAEVSREIQKQLGFNWSATGTIRSATLVGGLTNPFAGALAASQLGITQRIGDMTLSSLLDALDNEGLVSLLAEPNLTAISGETASFLAGGEFPILVPDSDGRVTITFKKFGISLAFTPVLVGESRINLHVRPEVSQLSNENAVVLNDFQIPSLTTRRAETTVELGSGQSFAIAGLIQNDANYDLSKTPGLANIPILGELFKSDNFQKSESELVIIITPYIVEPVNGNPFVKPTDRFYMPQVSQSMDQIEDDESPSLFTFDEEQKNEPKPRPQNAGFRFD